MENLEQIYTKQLWLVLQQFQPKFSDVMELQAIIYRINKQGEKEKEKWNCEPNKYRAINLWLAKRRLGEIS